MMGHLPAMVQVGLLSTPPSLPLSSWSLSWTPASPSTASTAGTTVPISAQISPAPIQDLERGGLTLGSHARRRPPRSWPASAQALLPPARHHRRRSCAAITPPRPAIPIHPLDCRSKALSHVPDGSGGDWPAGEVGNIIFSGTWCMFQGMDAYRNAYAYASCKKNERRMIMKHNTAPLKIFQGMERWGWRSRTC